MRTRTSYLINLLVMFSVTLLIFGAGRLLWFDQHPSLIPREILFGNPERAAPQISLDGKMLAYLAPVNGVLNVWVRTVGQNDDRAVTADTKRGIYGFIWQADCQHILYGQDKDGDENWHLYQTD